MAERRTGAKMIKRNGNGQDASNDDHHHNSPPPRINKIPQQAKTRASTTVAAAAGRGITTTTTSSSSSSPPKYLEPPNKQNNLHGIRRTQQRAATTSSRGSDHEYQGSSVVPKFAEWEEKDHVSGQGYTRAFERITDQRNMPGGGYVQSPSRPTQTPQRDESMGWCFFWRRKYK